MKRTLIAIGLVLGLASASHAVSVSVSADQAVYTVGDTITLTVNVDAVGATDTAIFGQLLYNPLMSFASSAQVGLVSFGGFVNWAVGVLTNGVGFADAFNQIGGLSPIPVDAPAGFAIATLTFTAAAPGTVNVNWETTIGPNTFDFFGLTNGNGTSFNIVPIPEPTTAALLGLGLFGLAMAGRRRA